MTFFAELKRRNVVRVGIAYLLTAWVALQVADVILPILETPAWVDKAMLGALAIGFPIAIILAWVYELTPEGVKLEKDADPGRPSTDVTGRKLDFVIIGVLVVAVAMFSLDKFVWSNDEYEIEAPHAIAVLPFLDMTADGRHEYFSDGLTEELLNLLVRIPELRVASRTSSFFYKGKDVRIADVGRDLGVGHVLEGSVRRADDRVRITAQLIDVPSDTHIWSEVWERRLDDIFAIQDEIARAVVDALKLELMDDLPSVAKTSPETYTLYLEAGKKMRDKETGSMQEVEQLLQEALRIDDAYVPAWLRLADTYTGAAAIWDYDRERLYALARDAAMNAIQVDPGSAEAVGKLSSIGIRYAAEADPGLYTRGLEPAPANGRNALSPADLGRSIEFLAQAQQADPQNAAMSFVRGQHLWLARRFPEAVAALENSIALDADRAGAHFYLGAALLGSGDAEAALQQMNQESSDGYRHAGRSIVFHAMGDSERSSEELSLLLEQGYRWPYQAAQAFAVRNATDDALTWLGHAVARRDSALFLLGGDPFMDGIRSDDRFARISAGEVADLLN